MSCHDCSTSCPTKARRRGGGWLPSWLGGNPQPNASDLVALPQVALVGSPNVGKSALFHALTGMYVTVSNYPGTTVEVARGRMQLGDRAFAVIDTPGMYSLLPITDEERVARDLLLQTPIQAVVHVVDAKNLGRMLPMTLQLVEAGLPVLLAVNMIDEAEQLGIEIQPEQLEQQLGVPVSLLAAALHCGIQAFKQKVAHYVDCVQVSPANRDGDRADRVASVSR